MQDGLKIKEMNIINKLYIMIINNLKNINMVNCLNFLSSKVVQKVYNYCHSEPVEEFFILTMRCFDKLSMTRRNYETTFWTTSSLKDLNINRV